MRGHDSYSMFLAAWDHYRWLGSCLRKLQLVKPLTYGESISPWIQTDKQWGRKMVDAY